MNGNSCVIPDTLGQTRQWGVYGTVEEQLFSSVARLFFSLAWPRIVPTNINLCDGYGLHVAENCSVLAQKMGMDLLLLRLANLCECEPKMPVSRSKLPIPLPPRGCIIVVCSLVTPIE
jgi:hypothetical protein